jgi:hypothetical protein
VKVGPIFRDFGVRNFASSDVQTFNVQKFKELTFWDFGNSGFGVSGFQVPKHYIQQSPNSEEKDVGPTTSGFQVLRTHGAKTQKKKKV